MANNRIQIKRSVTSGITNTTPTINAGELIFTSNGYVLAIGDPANSANVISIGGARYPGVLTANQAVVVNATSGIDKIIVANLAANGIWANGSAGSAGDVLTSNGTVVYWRAPSAGVAGSDTQVQFNDGGSLAGEAGFTFNKTTDTLTVNGAFTTGDTGTGTGGFIANDTVVFVGNNTINTVVSSGGLTVNGTATIANSTGVYTGVVNGSSITVGTSFTANSTLVNAAAINITGAVNTATLYATTSANIASAVQANSTGLWTTGTVNGAVHSIGATFIANTTGVYHTGTMNAASHTVGTSFTANSTLVNAAAINVTGQTNTGTLFVTTSANIGTAVIANSIGLTTTGFVNATGAVNAASHTVGTAFTANSTVVNAVSYYSGTLLVANTTVINATHLGGQLPGYYTNATNITTGTLPWAQAPTGTVNTSGSFTLAGNTTLAGTNTVISSNLTVSGANVNISGSNVNITANTNLAGTNTTISSNVILTGATLTGTSTDLSMRNGTFSGNLTVSGTVITVNTAQLQVNDNIIQLSYNQTTADAVDAGFSSVAGNATAIWYSGIARIAASSNSTAPVFRVFVTNTNPNSAATIDTSANTRTGFIQAYLAPYGIGGLFVANATNISISGNSTITLGLAANTLSLTTALPGTSGGTGLSSIANNSLIFGNSTNGFNTLALGTSGYVVQSNGTAIVYDVLDGGTF